MDIHININSIYREAMITAAELTLSSGLLDNQECIDLAREFLDCAYELLVDVKNKDGRYYDEYLENIANIINDL